MSTNNNNNYKLIKRLINIFYNNNCRYNDEDGEDFENDYILFFSWIPIIFLLMIVLFAYSNLKSFCLSKMKTDSVETLCLQSSNSRYT